MQFSSTQKRFVLDEEILVPARAENNPGIRHEINSIEKVSQKRDKILKLNKRSIWDIENPVARTTVLGKKAEMNPILQMLRAAAGQKTQKILGLNSKAFDIFPGPMPEERETTNNNLESVSTPSQQYADFSPSIPPGHHRRPNMRSRFNNRAAVSSTYQSPPQAIEMHRASPARFIEEDAAMEVPEQTVMKEFEGPNNGYSFQNTMQRHRNAQMFNGNPNVAEPVNFFRGQSMMFQRPQSSYPEPSPIQSRHGLTQARRFFPEMESQFEGLPRGIFGQTPIANQYFPFPNFNNLESEKDEMFQQQETTQGQQSDDYLNQVKESPDQQRIAAETASKAMMDDQDQEQTRQMYEGKAIRELQEAEFIQQQKMSAAMKEIANQQQQQQENELRVRHQLPGTFMMNRMLRFPPLDSNEVVNNERYHIGRDLNDFQAIKKQYTEPEPLWILNRKTNPTYMQAVTKQQTHPVFNYEHNKSLLPIGPISSFSSGNEDDEDEEKPEVHVHISTEKSKIAKPKSSLTSRKGELNQVLIKK